MAGAKEGTGRRERKDEERKGWEMTEEEERKVIETEKKKMGPKTKGGEKLRRRLKGWGERESVVREEGVGDKDGVNGCLADG